MNCPLCQRILKPDPDYPDCYLCPTKITYPDCMPVSHYERNNDFDENTDHQWYAGPYKIEMDDSGLSIYKVVPREYKTDYPSKPQENYVMYLDMQIPIDDSPKTINKIKTLIVFS